MNTGLRFGEALLLVFIVLKLTGVINWSWFWVLSPLWIGLGIFIFAMALIFLWHRFG